MKPNEQYQQVGDSLIRIYKDPTTGDTQFETVFTGTGADTSDIKNYQYYVSQEKAKGGVPLSFDEWLQRKSVNPENQFMEFQYVSLLKQQNPNAGIIDGDSMAIALKKIQDMNKPKTPEIPETPTTPTPPVPTKKAPETTIGVGGGGTVFQPTQTEQQKIAEENTRRAKLGFPPLSGGTTTAPSQTYPLTIDASGNITNLKEMPTSQLLDLYASFG